MQPTIHLESKPGHGRGKYPGLLSKRIVGCIFKSVGFIITCEILFIWHIILYIYYILYISFSCIQGVSEIRVLILTSERTRQFMKLFSITFYKIRKSIPRFFAPQFLPNESFCVIN
jgi:hypothetical protein